MVIYPILRTAARVRLDLGESGSMEHPGLHPIFPPPFEAFMSLIVAFLLQSAALLLSLFSDQNHL